MLFFFTKVLIKNKNLKNLLVTVLAQFTAKMTNSENTIYFLSLMSCSINKLKSPMFFALKNFMFFDFKWKKIFAAENGGGHNL